MLFYIETLLLILCVFIVVRMAYLDRKIDAAKIELIIMVGELKELRAMLGIAKAKGTIEIKPPKENPNGGTDWAS